MSAAYPVGAEEHGAEEASVDGGLVHHQGVLLVVPAIAGNRHDCVLPSRQLPAPDDGPSEPKTAIGSISQCNHMKSCTN